jgi:hypothetical protein
MARRGPNLRAMSPERDEDGANHALVQAANVVSKNDFIL